jgi:hypothetical protein
MDNLILFTFASYGLCHILMYGTILNSPRKWLTSRYRFFDELLKCSLCVGFWTGLLLKQNLVYALYSAATCYLLHLIIDILIDMAIPDDFID